jgi:hypothetical protein
VEFGWKRVHWIILIKYNNSIQIFIIYVPIQQLKCQLETQHSADTSNYITIIIQFNSLLNSIF